MTDKTGRLRAAQMQGYARWLHEHVPLGGDAPTLAEVTAAYERGLAGEPPPCGCMAVLRGREQAARTVQQQYPRSLAGHDYYVAANALRDARAALGDTEAVE